MLARLARRLCLSRIKGSLRSTAAPVLSRVVFSPLFSDAALLYIHTAKLPDRGSFDMNAHPDSAEAAALVRLVRATRAVSAAFDATRGEPEWRGSNGVARVLSRLDAALLELETSERSLDAILSRAAEH